MTTPSESTEKKMFFTTTDLLQRMNSAIKDAADEADGPSSSEVVGFELQRKMPNGSYRKADESELKAADFQAKMKQAAEMTSILTPREKIEWASSQRKAGNTLFANGDYREAMDIYLTCLVAMDASSKDTKNNTVDAAHKSKLEVEIQLPVLLNLALCALKLGMLSKAEKFCNYALELEAGRLSAKCYFRRGRIRMLMGNYGGAELDLDNALELLENGAAANGNSDSINGLQQDERQVVLKEKQKLQRLIQQAEKNQKAQKKAMERLFKRTPREEDHSHKSTSKSTVKAAKLDIATSEYDCCGSLYPEKKVGTRKYSTLRDDPNWDHSIAINSDSSVAADQSSSIRCYFDCYLQMIGRGAQMLLDIIGSEDDQDTITVSESAVGSSMSISKRKKDQ